MFSMRSDALLKRLTSSCHDKRSAVLVVIRAFRGERGRGVGNDTP